MKRLPLLLTLLIACGPINEPDPVNPIGPTGGGAKPAQPAVAGDVSIELDKIPLTNIIAFEPAALDQSRASSVPLTDPKRKVTLAQQRSIVSNVRDPVLKQAQAMVLATMLWREAKTAEKAKEKELWTEARQALRDAATAAGKGVDEDMLRMLASYDLLFDDFAAAEKAWQDLIAKEPKHEELPYRKAWWAYSLLKQGKNAEALKVVTAEPLEPKQPELAYATAWAKWRTGDGAGAWEAILTAATGWGNNMGKDAVETDVLLIAGRTKVTFAQAVPRLFEVFSAKQPAQQFQLLVRLGSSLYQYTGRWADGIAALEEALKVNGAQVTPRDRSLLRILQAEYQVRFETPDVTAKYVKQAIEALGCNPPCAEKEKQDVIARAASITRLFHILYATANDIRYYQPANDLYVLVVPLIADPKRQAEIKKDAETLQSTLKNTKVGTGTHSKDVVRVIVENHQQEVQACYEATLVRNPKVGGTLVVTLESDQTGVIKGVATEPKAGQADLPAVAGCVIEHARKWSLPKRGTVGTTRVKATFELSSNPAGAKGTK
jgi:tetratricopeptide (TPR) repeat protein